MCLNGRRVVNTRALHQAAAFDALLMARGVVPVSYPCIAIAPPEDTRELDSALKSLANHEYEWLVITSANTVCMLAQRARALDLHFSGVRVAAVGPSTAAAVESQLGLTVDVIPEEYVAESLVESLTLPPGTRVLVPESALARPVLAGSLRQTGAAVTEVTAYINTIGSGGEDVPTLLRQGHIDAIAFTSPSTVQNFLIRLAAEGGDRELLDAVCIGCIGPQTARAARDYGLSVDTVPDEHTLEGLVDALDAAMPLK